MHTTATGHRQAGGAPRRLSRRVLVPLLAGGLAAVLGASTGAAVIARQGASHTLDTRIHTLHSVAVRALHQSGSPGAAATLARAEGGYVRVARASRPLPGGHASRQRGGRRADVSTVSTRHGNVRLTVALPDASVNRTALRTFLAALAVGLALLVLCAVAVAIALRRAATRPLSDLVRGIDSVAAGQPARLAPGGALEVVAVGGRLDTLAARLAELESQATTDPLTGIGNRRSFQIALETELKRATRDARALTLVLIDLDGFKEINDTHGHPFGDGVLQMVAEKMRAALRATDVLARVGGDEFAILCPGTQREQAENLVERAREAAAGAIGGVSLTWSAGMAGFPQDARDAETLVDCADVALYCAKASGETVICHYDPEQSKTPASGGDHAAVELLLNLSDGIVPVYQPLVSLQTGELAGFEALARFPHPPARRPDEWFAIAARCGLGPQLERRAVEAALAAPDRPKGTYLSFNFSASALMSDEVIAALPFDLSDLVIEITENERVADAGALAERLAPLRARGARVAVDDAGAGYSGLQQVMRIQPDLIKLDRSLVANVDSDPAKAALIDSFVRFAARTGADVCAEGIETPEELKVLADLDVTYGQGFGIARPAAPWAEVAPWVAGTVRSRSTRPETDRVDRDPAEGADQRLAALTGQLANVRSSDELRGLATLMAAETSADEVALLRRGSDAGTLESVTDHRWLPGHSPLALSYYPTLRQVLASQEVFQVQESDPSADLGELALLGRSGHRSMLIAPIVAQGEVVGLLCAFGADDRPWTQAEISRARIVGHQLGAVIDALGAPAVAGASVVPLPARATA